MRPLTDKDATPLSKLPKETQEWIIAAHKIYSRLGLTDEEWRTLVHLTMKIRWGFSAADLESMSPKERAYLAFLRDFIIKQTNRFMGGASKPDPIAASYFGGRPRTKKEVSQNCVRKRR